MQQPTPVISRKEQALFELMCSVNEIHALQHELSILEIDEINQLVKKLCFSENQPQSNLAYQFVV